LLWDRQCVSTAHHQHQDLWDMGPHMAPWATGPTQGESTEDQHLQKNNNNNNKKTTQKTVSFLCV